MPPRLEGKRETHPYPSMLLYCQVVLCSVSRHRAGVRATVPAVQVRGEEEEVLLTAYNK